MIAEIRPSPSDYNCRKEIPDGPKYSFGRKYSKTSKLVII